MNIITRALGQVGYRFEYKGIVIYVDPYLSNSVSEKEPGDLIRLFPIEIKPSSIKDASYILITHDHRDHCDEETILPILEASPNCRVIGPNLVYRKLSEYGVSNKKLVNVGKETIKLGEGLTCQVVPSAHPEVEYTADGLPKHFGYVLTFGELVVYHPGDTSVSQVVIDKLKEFSCIDVAFLPVNERNYFRDKQNILGNMSVREAFQMAEDIGAKKMIPTHWDMFECNQVFREEIELLYRKIGPSFELEIYPESLDLGIGAFSEIKLF